MADFCVPLNAAGIFKTRRDPHKISVFCRLSSEKDR